MKRFCNCNISEAVNKTRGGLDDRQFCGDELHRDGFKDRCQTCGMYKWLDPYHENMIKDLRDMNE